MQRAFPWWLQAFLLIGALEALAIGASGWLAPTGSLFHRLLPPAVSPLNGRVIGGVYLAGAVGLLGSYLTRSAGGARIFVFGFGFIAGSLLVATFVYWDAFSADHVPVGWIATYAIDPVVAVLAIVTLGLWSPAWPGRHAATPALVAIAAVLIAAGLTLLLAPGFAVDHWPWKLTTMLARAYACLCLGFGLGAALAAWERRAAAALPVVLALTSLVGFVAVASLRHLDRFPTTAKKTAWFVVLGGLGIAALLALAGLNRERAAVAEP